MCTTPLQAWRDRKVGKNGKRGIVFKKNEGFSDQELEIGCGQCIECRMERSRVWAVRCCNEAQWNEEEGRPSCFLTLTYNDDNLPFVKSKTKKGEYYQTLVKRDIQLFLKRIRRKTEADIRYFIAGEYGGQFGRPHYHALLFGWKPSDEVLCDVSGSGHPVYSSDLLDERWTHGNVYSQQMCFETAFYTASYALKKLVGSGEYFKKKFGVESAEEYYDGVQPEFNLVSKNPAIGLRYYEKYRTDIYPQDKLRINGLTIIPPRYYYEKEVQYEECRGDRKENITGRFSKTELELIKVRRQYEMDHLPQEIKSEKQLRKRSRMYNQLTKARHYDEAKRTFGVSFHDIRQKELRILNGIDGCKKRCNNNKRIQEECNES